MQTGNSVMFILTMGTWRRATSSNKPMQSLCFTEQISKVSKLRNWVVCNKKKKCKAGKCGWKLFFNLKIMIWPKTSQFHKALGKSLFWVHWESLRVRKNNWNKGEKKKKIKGQNTTHGKEEAQTTNEIKIDIIR